MRWRGKSKLLLALCWILLAATILSGCLYPRERRLENQVPDSVYLETAQQAVERYRAEQGVLPIVNRPADTPIFEKYEIDFHKLVPRYLPDLPANAFEKGGLYKYVLIDVETQPTVRLIHLGVVNQVADVQQAVNRYKRNYDKLPVERDLGGGYFTIHYAAIGMEPQQVKSQVTGHYLPLVMNADGQVGIDYAADIAAVMRNSGKSVPEGEDPLMLIARESPFVPVKSFPYAIQYGEPQLRPE